jgi:hypothetical protein
VFLNSDCDKMHGIFRIKHTKVNWVKLEKCRWYEHVPKSVQTSHEGKVTILQNQQIQTHRTIRNNKADIIIRGHEKRTCMFIDVAISGDRKVINIEAEKILRCKDLTIEIQRMLNFENKSDTSNNRGN